MAALTNAQMMDEIIKYNSTYEQLTAKDTKTLMAERGLAFKNPSNTRDINAWIELTVRMATDMINVSRVKNPLSDSGIFERKEIPYGGLIQRISVGQMKPISPQFLNLQNKTSVDAWQIFRPEAKERIAKMNFAFQAATTISYIDMKTVTLEEYMLDYLQTAFISQLEEAYTKQEFENGLETIHYALTNSDWPLKDTQQYQVDSWTGNTPTDTELRGFVRLLKSIVEVMDSEPSTDMYNAFGYDTVANPEDHVLLLRRGIMPWMETETLYAAFHESYLLSPIQIRTIRNFGGIEYYSDSALTTRVYPQYSDKGQTTGWGPTENGSNPTITDRSKLYTKDPHADILGIICQKGIIPIFEQNPFQVIPSGINPFGLYNTFVASKANTGINYDPAYNLIVIKRPNAV